MILDEVESHLLCGAVDVGCGQCSPRGGGWGEALAATPLFCEPPGW